MKGMNYQEAQDYILGYTDYEKVPMPHALASYDLRRVADLLSRLGKPHEKARSVHIAGTNGKGSTAAMIAAVLTASGYKTGLYTSPHLLTIRERFKIDGRLISEDEFACLATRLRPEVAGVNREARYGELTTFELLTALGFLYFDFNDIDFQVLEVGMGGRFDATNVVTPEVSVITSVSLDHTRVLGDTPAQIVAEKCGIIKPGVTVVSAPQTSEVARVISEACRERNARLMAVGQDITWERLGFGPRGQFLEVKGRLGVYRLSLPLVGRHQLENAATAVGALEVLAGKGFHITRENIIGGVARVDWPGRLQVVCESPIVVVDGAHNPDAARRLRLAITEYFKFRRVILVIGASADKDVAGVASELAPIAAEVIVTQTHHPRALAPEKLAAIWRECGVETRTTASIPEALTLAASLAGEKDLICVAGSLFLVAEATSALGHA